jgi:hypothetical protein
MEEGSRMVDPPLNPDANDVEPGANLGPAAGTPRWVKVFGIIALVVILLIVVVMLVGGGSHGLNRHTSSGGADGAAAPAVVAEDGGRSVLAEHST